MNELTIVQAVYAFVAGFVVGGLVILEFTAGDCCAAHEEGQ